MTIKTIDFHESIRRVVPNGGAIVRERRAAVATELNDSGFTQFRQH
jgi:hypothetical protein